MGRHDDVGDRQVKLNTPASGSLSGRFQNEQRQLVRALIEIADVGRTDIVRRFVSATTTCEIGAPGRAEDCILLTSSDFVVAV